MLYSRLVDSSLKRSRSRWNRPRASDTSALVLYTSGMTLVADAVAAFQRWRGARPEQVEIMTGGLRNAMVRVDDWIVRFYLRDATACVREVALLRMLAGDVPVPEVVHVGDGEPPWVLLRYIEGVPFKELDADGRRRAARSLGQAIAGISRHPGPNIGPPHLHEPSLAFVSASELLQSRLGRLASRVEAIAADPVSQEARLVHGDLRKWNVLVRDDRCVGIIDWELAHSGSPLEDLGLLLRYERYDRPRFERELVEGLIEGGAVLADDWRRLSRIVDLAAMCRSLAEPALPQVIVEELVHVIEGSLSDLRW